MDKIIIINDNGIQSELEEFLIANKKHVRFSSDMDEISMSKNSLLQEIIKRYEEKHKVKIQSKDNVRFFKLNDIVHLESAGTKTTLFQSDNNKIEVNESIDKIETQLQDFPFFRTHQNHIINLNHIVKVADETGDNIELSNGSVIPVTESNKKMIIKFLNRYI